MQHSALSSHLNISVWSAERESDRDTAAQTQTKVQQGKGTGEKVCEAERVSDVSGGRGKDG